MNFSPLNIALAISLVALSNTAVASSDPESLGSEGVIIDISQIDLRSDSERAADAEAAKAAAVAMAEAEAERVAKAAKAAEAAEAAKAAKEAKAAAAEAARKKRKEVFNAVVDSMRPQEQVPALNNDRFSAYLSDKVFFGQYERKTERFDLDRARTHLGLLVSEERDTIVQAGLALDASSTKSFRLSFGARAYIALLSLENMDAFATAFGAETAYKLPFKALPLEFGASMYYAPDILTFGAGDRAVDTQLDVTVPVRPQLSVFGGVRFLQIDTRPGDREIDNRAHLGVRWDFK